MNSLLPSGLLLGILLAVVGLAQASGPQDNRRYDLDGDGAVSILDVAILAEHFLERVPAPDQCVVTEHYVTPETAYRNGTPYLVAGRGYVPTEHPQHGIIASGTPLALQPCS